MPTILYANDIAEEALREIGAFTTSMEQADAAQMKVALRRLELVLNVAIGTDVYLPAWREYDIPLVSGQQKYHLADFVDDNGVQFITGTKLIDTTTGRHYHFDLVNEVKFMDYDNPLSGRPYVGYVSNTDDPNLFVFPLLNSSTPAGQFNLHVVAQVYANKIDPSASQNVNLNLRPTWYLWAIKRLAYNIGCGPVLRLPDNELKSIGEEASSLEDALLSVDGKFNTTDLPVTHGHDVCGINCGMDSSYGMNRPDYHSLYNR